ncbi:hypothetical protein [Microvirga vignae]|uniref:hypothetical protein n=1 Tax=Microvirga vignae TaxID=1225564 RepID=UPI000AEBEDA9|nr:hypothetical protein [Microvirga vignae]
MNMSDMAHRVTDAIKRMTDRLTHRRDIQPKRPTAKSDEIGLGASDKWDDVL